MIISDNRLDPDTLQEPFRGIVNNVANDASTTYESLGPYMRKSWCDQPFEVQILDDDELNACASNENGRFCISIKRGALEEVFGTANWLMRCPYFMPAFGDSQAEVEPPESMANKIPVMPFIDDSRPIPRPPKDERRTLVAHLLADIALSFLVHHEIGHIIGGHLEYLDCSEPLMEIQDAKPPCDSELCHVLECDADAFAGHSTRAFRVSTKYEEILADIVSSGTMSTVEKSHVMLMTGVGVLFRLMCRETSLGHPHPAVRAHLVCSAMMARSGQQRGMGDDFAGFVSAIMEKSVVNVETAWKRLRLRGCGTGTLDAASLQLASRKLANSYEAMRSNLDKCAHLPRAWHDWKWTARK